MNKFYVNKSALAKLKDHDKSFVKAYLFSKSLTQFVKHPILFNFKTNSEAYRLKLGMGRYKYRRLLKLAISLNLVKYHGDNLHLISRSQERKIFGVKNRRQTAISPGELHDYANAQIIIKNFKSQKKAIAHHNTGRRSGFALSAIDSLTQYPVLSRRTAGQFLNCSHAHVKNLLTKLKAFGLTFHKNKVQIGREEYKQLKLAGSYNIRWNDGNPFYLGADSIEYRKVGCYVSSGFSYCNDI